MSSDTRTPIVNESRRSRRDFVFDRDGDRDRCVYCDGPQRGPTFLDRVPNRLTLDHLIPTSKGGRTVRSNLVTCCNRCNNARGDKDIVEWLALLNPRESIFGERAVKMVIQAMKSDVKDAMGDNTLKRIQATFSYVR